MSETNTPGRGADVAAGLLFVLGTFQGAGPLVVGLARDDRRGLLLARHLPAPWWSIASAAVLIACWASSVALLARRQSPARTDRHRQPRRATAPGAWSSVLFALALTQGVVPLLSKLLLDGAPIWALPARLPSPWWWITAVGVILTAALVLDALDRTTRPGAPGA